MDVEKDEKDSSVLTTLVEDNTFNLGRLGGSQVPVLIFTSAVITFSNNLTKYFLIEAILQVITTDVDSGQVYLSC